MHSQKTLVDTSAWIETLQTDGDPELRSVVLGLTADGNAVLCDIVRLELWDGARGSTEHRMLRNLEKELESVPTVSEVWDRAAELARTCRRAGLTVPAPDLLIVACAEHHDLRLLYTDSHFDQIATILRH